MNKLSKRLLSDALLLTLGSIAVFLLAHIYYLTESTALMYVELYAEKIWSFLFPLLAVRMALSSLAYGIRGAVLSLTLAVLSRTVFFYPFYYEYYVLDGGFVTGDALLAAALHTGILLLGTAVHVCLYYLLAIITGRVLRERSGENLTLGEYLTCNEPLSIFDVTSPAVLISLIIAALELVYSLIREIIDTAEFLSTPSLGIEPVEIFTLVFNYILLLALFFLGHFLVVKLGRKNEE